MKRLLLLFGLGLVGTSCVMAQPQPPPPATVAETAAGTVRNKFISPYTLQSRIAEFTATNPAAPFVLREGGGGTNNVFVNQTNRLSGSSGYYQVFMPATNSDTGPTPPPLFIGNGISGLDQEGERESYYFFGHNLGTAGGLLDANYHGAAIMFEPDWNSTLEWYFKFLPSDGGDPVRWLGIVGTDSGVAMQQIANSINWYNPVQGSSTLYPAMRLIMDEEASGNDWGRGHLYLAGTIETFADKTNQQQNTLTMFDGGTVIFRNYSSAANSLKISGGYQHWESGDQPDDPFIWTDDPSKTLHFHNFAAVAFRSNTYVGGSLIVTNTATAARFQGSLGGTNIDNGSVASNKLSFSIGDIADTSAQNATNDLHSVAFNGVTLTEGTGISIAEIVPGESFTLSADAGSGFSNITENASEVVVATNLVMQGGSNYVENLTLNELVSPTNYLNLEHSTNLPYSSLTGVAVKSPLLDTAGSTTVITGDGTTTEINAGGSLVYKADDTGTYVYDETNGLAASFLQAETRFTKQITGNAFGATNVPVTALRKLGGGSLTNGTAGQSLKAGGDGTAYWANEAGGGDALTSQPLSQFAATSVEQFLSVITGGVLTNTSGQPLVATTNAPSAGNIIVRTGDSWKAQAPTAVSPLLDTAGSSTVITGDGNETTVSASGVVQHRMDETGNFLYDEAGNVGMTMIAASVSFQKQIVGDGAGITNMPLKMAYPVACSDTTTDITTGDDKVTFRMPFAGTLTAVRASCSTAPVGSTIIIDIEESGTTVLSTLLSIDASEKTSVTAASQAVISDSALADDAEISINFDQVGSSTAGKGVIVTLYFTATP